MEDTIINGYIVIWAVALFLCWVPLGFLHLELVTSYNKPKGRKRSILKTIFAINIIVVIICLLTLPLQIALIQELWRV